MSNTVDLDVIERALLERVTPENVANVLLLDIARSLRALVGTGTRNLPDVGNRGQAERLAGTAVPDAPPSTQVG